MDLNSFTLPLMFPLRHFEPLGTWKTTTRVSSSTTLDLNTTTPPSVPNPIIDHRDPTLTSPISPHANLDALGPHIHPTSNPSNFQNDTLNLTNHQLSLSSTLSTESSQSTSSPNGAGVSDTPGILQASVPLITFPNSLPPDLPAVHDSSTTSQNLAQRTYLTLEALEEL
ncbi:hypothetical protein Clacol_004113 [Clathrus columnatus]|uniref:Uncharacterized protein n=1 Tax=Clathrus columnatus TaxID=1419009 RepID=A0AAV5A9J4_9AGAM|nr:hypothetical protein Clacol_004113 [Clathrus columnatus]